MRLSLPRQSRGFIVGFYGQRCGRPAFSIRQMCLYDDMFNT